MSSKTNAVTFAFGKPRFPLICDLDGELFAAKSATALRRLLVRVELLDKEKIRFVDTSGGLDVSAKGDDFRAEIFSENVAQDRSHQLI